MIAKSASLRVPFAFTSDWKFVSLTTWPSDDLVWDKSVAFTVPFAFVSPIKMLIGIVKLVAGAYHAELSVER